MPASLSSDDKELVSQLLEDVQILDDQFAEGLAKPSATRAIFAPILRRWMVEALFFKAQQFILPHQVGFPIRSNAKTLKLCKAGLYVHWMGLVEVGPFAVSSMLPDVVAMARGGTANGDIHDSLAQFVMPQRAKSFFDQRMFYWKSRFYTRMDVLKMHANALGGVHFDFRKATSETHIKELKNFLGFEVLGNKYNMLVGKTIEAGRADPQRRHAIYDATELISMDTARIFASGIRAARPMFAGLLD